MHGELEQDVEMAGAPAPGVLPGRCPATGHSPPPDRELRVPGSCSGRAYETTPWACSRGAVPSPIPAASPPSSATRLCACYAWPEFRKLSQGHCWPSCPFAPSIGAHPAAGPADAGEPDQLPLEEDMAERRFLV